MACCWAPSIQLITELLKDAQSITETLGNIHRSPEIYNIVKYWNILAFKDLWCLECQGHDYFDILALHNVKLDSCLASPGTICNSDTVYLLSIERSQKTEQVLTRARMKKLDDNSRAFIEHSIHIQWFWATVSQPHMYCMLQKGFLRDKKKSNQVFKVSFTKKKKKAFPSCKSCQE